MWLDVSSESGGHRPRHGLLASRGQLVYFPMVRVSLGADTERESTIVRFVLYIGDSENLQIDLWYDEDDGPNCRLARYVFIESFEGKLVRTREESVLEYEAEPAFTDSLFYVEPQPGFNVADHVTDRRYRVGLPGQPDRDLAEIFFEQELGHRSGTFRVVFLAINVLVILISVLIFAHYHKRRKAGAKDQ